MELKRDSLIDTAKGIGIIAVVIGHIIFNIIQKIVYTFHLPLFFILSGYFFCDYCSFDKFLLKKSKSYLIPYAFFSSIIILFDYWLYGFDPAHLIFDLRSFIMQRRFKTLWFLTTLYLCSLIYYIIFKLFSGNIKGITITVIIFSTLFILYDQISNYPLIWNLDTAFISIFFYHFGYLLKKHNMIEKIKNQTPLTRFLYLILLVGICAFCSILNYFLCGITFEMFYNQYGVFPLTVAAACTGSLAVLFLSSFLTSFSFLQWLGRNSIVFFALHQSVALPLSDMICRYIPYFSHIQNTFSRVLRTSFTFVCIFVLCFIFHSIIMKANLGFMIGKSKSKTNLR